MARYAMIADVGPSSAVCPVVVSLEVTIADSVAAFRSYPRCFHVKIYWF